MGFGTGLRDTRQQPSADMMRMRDTKRDVESRDTGKDFKKLYEDTVKMQ